MNDQFCKYFMLFRIGGNKKYLSITVLHHTTRHTTKQCCQQRDISRLEGWLPALLLEKCLCFYQNENTNMFYFALFLKGVGNNITT